MKKTILALTALAAFASFNANAASSASGTIVSGTTFANPNAFQFTNTSTDGQKITKLTWDLTAINAFFDTTNAPLGNRGFPLTLSTDSDSVGELFPSNASVDGQSILTINFSDFDAGETFIFGADTDYFAAIDAPGVNGDGFIGAYVTAYFSDGTSTVGTYEATNEAGKGSAVSITGVNAVPVPAAAFLFAPALIGFMGLRRKTNKTAA